MHDLRYSVRTLSRSPGFALSAVLTLALGIGANAAVFAVVYAVLLNPLPYRQPGRLVRIWETNLAQGIERGDVSPGSYVSWRDRSQTLDGVALYLASPRQWLLSFGGEPEVVKGTEVTPGLFDVLGTRPILGRTFHPERSDAPVRDAPEIVLGYGLWQRRFGGAADVIGKTLVHEGRSALTVIGVMPKGFDFPGGIEAWGQERFDGPLAPTERLYRYYASVARLRDSRSIGDARTELATISAALATEFPNSNAGYGVRVDGLDDAMVGHVRLAFLMLLGPVGCVLLIACANVTNLMLARISSRRHETAVRIALGAGIGTLLRQRFAEAVMIAALGGAAGAALGYWGTAALVALAPADIPRVEEIAFGGPVVLFTMAVSLLSAFGTSLLPLWQGRKLDVADTLKISMRSTSSTSRSRSWLIAAQVALTLMLLIGSTLLLRSFVRLRHVDLGFDAAQVLTADLRLAVGRFPDLRRPWFALGQYYDRILQELAAVPGIESVSGVTEMPLTGEASAGNFSMDDGSGVRPDTTGPFAADLSVVTPEYFATMGIPLVRGRSFSPADRLSQKALIDPPKEANDRPRGVVLINQAFAERFWPGQDPVGRAIRLFDHWAVSSSTVVGVVGDVRAAEIAAPAEPAIYVPWGEIPGFRLAIAARVRPGVEGVAPAMRARLKALDSQLLVSGIRPMNAVISGALSRPRFHMVLVSCFALLALTLAAVGIHAVVGYHVIQRTREVGIRMALGARSADVLRLVLRQGLTPVLAGVVAGAILSAAGARMMRTLVFEIAPFDPASFALAGASLLLVALLAAWLPARRATAVDPLVALREE
jgi:putative ABC transport system permease protein